MNTENRTNKNQNANIMEDCEFISESVKPKASKKKLFLITPAIALTVAVASITWGLANYPVMSKNTAEISSSAEIICEQVDKSATYVTSDNLLYYYDAEADKSIFITDSALKYAETDSYDYEYIHITENKNNVYYMKDFENCCDYKSGTLCVRSLVNPDEAPVIIDTDVKEYIVVKDNEKIVYSKFENSLVMYEYDAVSGEKTYVCDSENNYMCLEQSNADKYYYLDDSQFCEKTFGKDSKCITDNVSGFYVDKENGCVFIDKYESPDYRLKFTDFIEYDIKKEDYHNKEVWDMLETEVYKPFIKASSVYNGTEVINFGVNASLVSYGDTTVYYTIDYDTDNKIKVSEIKDVYDVYNHISNQAITTIFIHKNGVSEEIARIKGKSHTYINQDKNKLVFIDYYHYDHASLFNEGDLISVSLTGKNAGKAELVNHGVFKVYFDGNDLIYAKNLNYNTLAGDFYVNGKLHCKNASEFHYSNGKSAYMTNYVYEHTKYRGKGTFAVKVNGNEEAVSNELITNPIILNDGSVAYILHDDKTNESQLYRFSNEKNELIGTPDYKEYSFCGNINNADGLYYVNDSNLYFIHNGETKLVAENVINISANSLY